MHVRARVAHQRGAQQQAERDVSHAEIERLGPQPEARGDVAGGERRAGHGNVPGELVQPHGQAAPLRADQVDLHDHGGRPSKPLAHAEEEVGHEHPFPARCPHEEEGHRNGEQPSADQHRFTADPVGVAAREIIGERLGEAEYDDEGEDRGACGQLKLGLRDLWEDRPFEPDHGADEGIDHHQQGELRQVLAQTQLGLPVRRPACHGGATAPPARARHDDVLAGRAISPPACATRGFLRHRRGSPRRCGPCPRGAVGSRARRAR